MKQFLIKTFIFSLFVITPLIYSLFFIPGVKSQNSILGALPGKNATLAKIDSPKIILIGGSSVSFGFDSKRIIDAYHMPVFNTALSRMLGLKFMVRDVMPYIKKGDIVVLAAEYHCYYNPGDFNGDQGLVATLFDTYRDGTKYIDLDQGMYLFQYVMPYAISKINMLYMRKAGDTKAELNDVYGRNSFNQYGDTYMHWNKSAIPFEPEPKCTGKEELLPEVIPFIKDFDKYVSGKQAKLVILPCVFQDTSYQNQTYMINKVELALKQNKLPLIAEPARYKFPAKDFFNNPYHLLKPAVDRRTDMVIADLAKIIHKN